MQWLCASFAVHQHTVHRSRRDCRSSRAGSELRRAAAHLDDLLELPDHGLLHEVQEGGLAGADIALYAQGHPLVSLLHLPAVEEVHNLLTLPARAQAHIFLHTTAVMLQGSSERASGCGTQSWSGPAVVEQGERGPGTFR